MSSIRSEGDIDGVGGPGGFDGVGTKYTRKIRMAIRDLVPTTPRYTGYSRTPNTFRLHTPAIHPEMCHPYSGLFTPPPPLISQRTNTPPTGNNPSRHVAQSNGFHYSVYNRGDCTGSSRIAGAAWICGITRGYYRSHGKEHSQVVRRWVGLVRAAIAKPTEAES